MSDSIDTVIAEMRALHTSYTDAAGAPKDAKFCEEGGCGPWPCPTIRLCDEVDRLRETLTALTEVEDPS